MGGGNKGEEWEGRREMGKRETVDDDEKKECSGG